MGNIGLRDPDTVSAAERGREFWRAVLLAGGSTALPRSTLELVPGVGEHERRISPTNSWQRCAGWRKSWRCRSARCC